MLEYVRIYTYIEISIMLSTLTITIQKNPDGKKQSTDKDFHFLRQIFRTITEKSGIYTLLYILITISNYYRQNLQNYENFQ